MSVGNPLLVLALGFMGEEGPRVELGGTERQEAEGTSKLWAGSSSPVPRGQCPCPPQATVA